MPWGFARSAVLYTPLTLKGLDGPGQAYPPGSSYQLVLQWPVLMFPSLCWIEVWSDLLPRFNPKTTMSAVRVFRSLQSFLHPIVCVNTYLPVRFLRFLPFKQLAETYQPITQGVLRLLSRIGVLWPLDREVRVTLPITGCSSIRLYFD
jgi:hypothetical protein